MSIHLFIIYLFIQAFIHHMFLIWVLDFQISQMLFPQKRISRTLSSVTLLGTSQAIAKAFGYFPQPDANALH